MSSTPIVRFAPSPTGRIHIGNARTALLNWLFARPGAGRFSLRFDDTDLARSRAEYAEAVECDLAWLGNPTCSTGSPSESRSTIPPRSAGAI
jgi:glutamyl-tRNA synthetase